jgi:hypothetical protein
MARTYNFELPYEISSFMISMGLSTLKSDGIYDALPADLQAKADAAYNNSTALVITQADCDEIDDETWGKLSSVLGLS